MNSGQAFTNTESIVPEKVDIGSLNEICDDWHKAFVSQFKGLSVRIDESLEGGQYYIAVSRELFEELVEQKNEQA